MELITGILLFMGGLFAGVINTIVGGGSLISVPLLIASGLSAHIAIGTNRFAMVFNTGVGAIDYYRRVNYEVKLAAFFAVFASIGSYLGANIVLQIEERILEYIIAILMLVMGGITVYKKKLGLKEEKIDLTIEKYVLIAILSFFLGIYGGFFGAGISTMFTFVFVSFFKKSFIRSAGMTRFIVSILSIIAVYIFFVNSKIDFLYGVILAMSFIAGAKIGVKLAFKAGNIWIRRLFMFLALVSSIKLLFF
jgi:uncharacterized membrane protein YfcA